MRIATNLLFMFMLLTASAPAVQAAIDSSIDFFDDRNLPDEIVILIFYFVQQDCADPQEIIGSIKTLCRYQRISKKFQRCLSIKDIAALLKKNNFNAGVVNATWRIVARDNRAHIAHILLAAHADWNAQDYQAVTPLHICLQEKNHDLFQEVITWSHLNLHQKQLLDFLNVRNEGNATPLHLAVRMNYFEGVAKIIECAQDCLEPEQMTKILNAHDNQLDATALYWAAENDNFEIIALLLAAGADANILDKYGKTALHYVGKYRPHKTNNNYCYGLCLLL